ncbi:dTDP-4-dehydrorhamnose 3,5-epimerase-like enzyme [Xenococcus sp. PCC 7305]|uniref:dTDP-4-dehydrorhamnose 3,5-epimerase family protein n=1 Tax=Xenococcus sp. PCC 7305 TaxID=102125 RepID=UPI0002ACCBB3|nr:dTDP-4-dehydrorhamnose 3,5-epimerase family protein [Xenococcus sp. PCC 7305]ELS00689.1 dTDP-4-dehydrorhamnose 3,5-epimerase-like enzyme [Xenococcus sp. PCC 7305]
MIQDVIIQPLKLIPNERGRLMEIQRRDNEHFISLGQIYITETFPGIIKAWYRHHKQIDQIAAITGMIKLVLFDSRESSPSYGKVQEIIIGELAPKLVKIPPKIWHGFQTISLNSAFLIHLNSEMFDSSNSDEDRLPVNTMEIPYQWN